MKYIFLLILLFFCFSCSTNEKKQKSSLKINSNQIKSQEKIITKNNENFNSIFKKISDVELKPNTEHLITSIEEIITTNNYFIIADQYGNKLLVFDRNGKFQNIIGGTGSGPGEFQTIQSITINDKNEILLLDNSKVSKYKLNGKFIKSIPVQNGGNSILADVNDGFYLYSPNCGIKPIEVDLIKHYNKRGEVINSFCKPFFEFGLVDGKLVNGKDGNLYVTQQLSNIVQKFTVEGKHLLQYDVESINHNILELKNNAELPKLEELNRSTMLIGVEISTSYCVFQFLNNKEEERYSWLDIYDLYGQLLATDITIPSYHKLSDIRENDAFVFYDVSEEDNDSDNLKYRILEYVIDEKVF
jgi:hypothetical protein